MAMRLCMVILGVAAAAARGGADEPAPERRAVRVLEDPRDIASFYGSRDAVRFEPETPVRRNPYAISGFYRQRTRSRPAYVLPFPGERRRGASLLGTRHRPEDVPVPAAVPVER